jgi:hypothetical protein
MTRITPTRALSIGFSAAALLLAMHAANAAPGAPGGADVSRVDVVGQLPLRDACPSVDARDLADQLASTWDAAAKPSSVEVRFKVQRHHVYDVEPATDSPRVYHDVRHAVHGMTCDGGDDRAHAVRFVLRFVDADRQAATAAVSVADSGDPAHR